MTVKTQRAVAILLTVLLCTAFGGLVSAQDRSRIVNPQAIEFDLPPGAPNTSSVVSYRVEFFEAGLNPERDAPIKSVAVGVTGMGDRTVRVDILSFLADLADGEYVAALRTDDPQGRPQSEPSPVFMVKHEGLREDALPAGPRDRFWTKVGLAIAGGLLLVPILVR